MARKPDQRKKELVQSWQQNHPDGSLNQCVRETGLSYATVRKSWDTELRRSRSSQNRVLDWIGRHPGGTPKACAADLFLDVKTVRLWWPDPVSSGVLKTVVSTWQKNHPRGTRRDCMMDTGLTRYQIAPFFKQAEPPPSFRESRINRICEWLSEHPGGTFLECARDLQIALPALAELWNVCYARPVICPRCGGFLVRGSFDRKEGFFHIFRERACREDFLPLAAYRAALGLPPESS